MRRRDLLKAGVSGGFSSLMSLRPSLGWADSLSPPTADGVRFVPVDAPNAEALSKSFNRAHQRTPRWRALCETAQGVARALLWARENGLSVAIRAGGHCFAGASGDGDVVLDLRRMRDGAVAPEGRVARIGAGALTQDAIETLSPLGLMLPAGYCQTVGLAGQALGGGMGYAARAFGLLSDHLIGLQMIDAEGRLMNVDAENHPDLFWACRGGGGGLGVVTRLDFELRPVRAAHHWRMSRQLDHDAAADFLAAWTAAMATAPREISSIAYLTKQSGTDQLTVDVAAVCIGSPALLTPFESALTRYAPAGEAPDRLTGDWKAVSDRLWLPGAVGAGRYAFKSAFGSAELGRDCWGAVVDAMLSARGFIQGFCQALGGAVGDLARPDTAYPHREPLSFQFSVYIDGDQETASARRAGLDELAERVAPCMTGGAYANYKDVGLTNWAQAYWAENLPRLRAMKRRYDPDNVFQQTQSISP